MKLNSTLLATAGLLAVSAGAAMAQTSTVLASSTGITIPNVSYTNPASFTGSDPRSTYTDRVTATLLPSTPFTLNAGTAGSFDSVLKIQNFVSGGSFSYGAPGAIVLSGTFATSTLQLTGVDTFAFVANNVVFTGGSNLHGFSTGALQLEAINASPTSGTSLIGANGFNPFTATDGVTIKGVQAVPEPATTVPFVLGGLGLLTLIVRKTRRASRAAV